MKKTIRIVAVTHGLLACGFTATLSANSYGAIRANQMIGWDGAFKSQSEISLHPFCAGAGSGGVSLF